MIEGILDLHIIILFYKVISISSPIFSNYHIREGLIRLKFLLIFFKLNYPQRSDPPLPNLLGANGKNKTKCLLFNSRISEHIKIYLKNCTVHFIAEISAENLAFFIDLLSVVFHMYSFLYVL